MPDAERFGDSIKCNTLANVARYNNGLSLPNLRALGLGNITEVMGVDPVDAPLASYGQMLELSEGKDTTTGHWEMAGLVLEKPFRVYPKGFPDAFMEKFIKKTGCGGYYANCPASGTDIIEQYNQEHKQTGFPIVYTSADSVFQIACNVDIISVETLYKWCEIARELLNNGYDTSRVIARPYQETLSGLRRLADKRKDYSVKPTRPTLLNKVKDNCGRVIAIGKIEDIFVGSGVTHSIHTGSNKDGLEITIKILKREFDLDSIQVTEENCMPVLRELVFVNLVDTDMLFGHRNDALGYGRALEEIDCYMGKILQHVDEDDLLIITADHGCDPTQPGTDHTREKVPVLTYKKNHSGRPLGLISTFSYVADESLRWLGIH